MLLKELESKIENKTAVIGVIGLGYVGLPVAACFADAGFKVIGVDILAERVAKISSGQSPIEGKEPGLEDLLKRVIDGGNLKVTTDYNELAQADIVLIDVETPVDSNHRPKYDALKAACTSLGPRLKEGALIIIESTIAPGTIDRLVRPLLEEHSEKFAGEDFYLGACPERVMPGKLLKNLRTMSRVCGGTTPETAEVMVKLYQHIVDADLDTADAVTAELVKTTENAYRDVQIAFANEVALICEAVGGDVWQVRELVNKVPYRNMHLPGAGVGGHCIPKDPWLLANGASDQVQVRLIPQARAVNDGMPLHMADLTIKTLQFANVDPSEARVIVLGYSYLEESDDTRNSPSQSLVGYLQGKVGEVIIHDPWVEMYKGDLLSMAKDCDAAIIMVAHQEYRELNPDNLRVSMRNPIVIDGRHVIEKKVAEAAGFIYRGVGQGFSTSR
ncbi:MAG: nucleotide sugar dehydrogenase [Chloroflexota bacterium]|jgi:UDP-N-acetyl-D-mannosaminuronic acid dehydrogenase